MFLQVPEGEKESGDTCRDSLMHGTRHFNDILPLKIADPGRYIRLQKGDRSMLLTFETAVTVPRRRVILGPQVLRKT
jgi:hypothetical protein